MQIGDSIGKLHDGGLIHGDLTTSNMPNSDWYQSIDGSHTGRVQEVLETVVINIEQASSSSTKRSKAHHDWINVFPICSASGKRKRCPLK
ncbi:hypothetical protein NC652_005524 [Populus alba x Populus x berolinensis]|nr:hypothetical protein NC652_005524 [Populus alba x Populus x berolinensis]